MADTNRTSSQLHADAEWAREKEQYEEALHLYSSAIIGYQKENNYEKIAELHLGIALTYKHLFQTTKDTLYIVLAEYTVLTSLSLIEKYRARDLIYTALQGKGEIAMMAGEFQKAADAFRQALEKLIEISPEKLAERGRCRYHLGDALCGLGKTEEGVTLMKQGLQEIRNNRSTSGTGEAAEFVANVWESGCLIRLADRLINVDLKESKKYLEQARKIIERDPRLIIRRRHLNEVENKL